VVSNGIQDDTQHLVVRRLAGGLTKYECHSATLPRSKRHKGVVDTPQERGSVMLHVDMVGTNRGDMMMHTVIIGRSADERERRDANEPIGIRSVMRRFDERQPERLPECI
jgi:hypothetical protein